MYTSAAGGEGQLHSFVTIDPTPPRACFTGAGVGGSEGSVQLHTGGEWCTGPSPLRAFSQLVSRRRHRALAPEPPASPALKRARPGAAPPSRRSHPRLTRRSALALPPASPSAPEPRRPPLRSATKTAPERSRSGATPRRDAPERDWPCSGAKSGFAPEPSRRDAGAGPTRRRSAASPVAPEPRFADNAGPPRAR